VAFAALLILAAPFHHPKLKTAPADVAKLPPVPVRESSGYAEVAL
jgi:hypothetical protein